MIDIFINGTSNYALYLWGEITTPHATNYFYWLISISLFFWSLEYIRPWRTEQHIIRKDFWLDCFYMFFNFFLFNLIVFNGLSDIGVYLWELYIGTHFLAIQLHKIPTYLQLLLLFVLKDFIHWNIHRLLHRIPFLWRFHQVHHSVHEMGFAAHLRFHPMETVIYKSLEYIPLSLIGFSVNDFFSVYLIGLFIGHLNHSNIHIPMGFLKYLFNSPQMHIWHHSKDLPTPYGVNFGLSLSIWDYLFKTSYIPFDGKEIPLGFTNDQLHPKTFLNQLIYPFRK